MRVREHRGNLQDSLATEFNADSKQQLVESMSKSLAMVVNTTDVKIEFYTIDPRDNWGDTYIITYKGSVFGFSDGMLE
jgi:hypothetical protein